MIFRLGQRVRVVTPANEDRLPLKGLTGTICRLRFADDCAWVNMDADLPEGFAAFPATKQYSRDEPEPRHRHILLAPEECEPA